MVTPSELYRRLGLTGLAAILFLLLGGQLLRNAIESRGRVEMECGRYLAERPHDKWVKLEGCVLSRISTVTKDRVGQNATEVYVPVRAATEDGRANPRILLASSAPEDLQFVNRSNAPQTQRMNRSIRLENYREKLEETRAIEGRVLRGGDFSDRERASLLKALPTLASDFIIIEERPRPGFVLPLGLLFCGLAFGGLRMFSGLSRTTTRRASRPGRAVEELFAMK